MAERTSLTKAASTTDSFDRVANEIEESVNEIAGHLNAQHARLVDHVATLQGDRRMWQGPGVWTMAQWLAWRTGVSTATARRIVAVAERIDELPDCVDRFRRGELSLDQVSAIAKRAPAWTDHQMSNLATSMTVRQIQRLLAEYPFPHDDAPDDPPDAEADPPVDAHPDTAASDDNGGDEDEREAAAGRPDDGASATTADAHDATDPTNDSSPARPVTIEEFCSMLWNDDGTFRLHAAADAEAGRIIESALREARDRLFHDGHPDVTWLDALREMAHRSLDAVADPARRRRFTINLFLDTDGTLSDTTRWTLPDTLRSQLLCDGTVVPTWREDGLPVSVGRSQHIVPDRTRSLVEQRDRARCRVPGCTAGDHLEVHHIIHWLHDGPTDTWNLICLCPYHHRLHHRGLLGITGNADLPGGVTFTNRHGRPIAQSGAKPIPPPGPPPPPAGAYRHPTGERFESRWFEFHRRPTTTTAAAAPPAAAR